ncbi:phosphotriesterase-related protein [Actinomycetospora sp. NBRC 106378]|uniref:phosphotriesterase family protein n=1 Tax=Actinomycetospora sp. NBRC 106378 TaxID=3032208 RepID=UPI002556C59A|nr:phosphotriesterase-related protein [Actinomycetospora sp. NBRC 106378]
MTTTSTTTVPTVRGPVAADQLGQVLAHEHVFVRSEEILRNYPHLWDEPARVADAVARLQTMVDRGVRTIVDPTVIGLGRDVERVARVNAQVHLNIVVATGVYTYDSVPFFFSQYGPGTLLGGDDPMVELFVRDITDGIADTGIRAGMLKCAIETELTVGVERVLVAVAAAHRATGTPITVHTSPGHGTGAVALDVLEREGVDLCRVVLGHSGDSDDVDALRGLADRGAILGMDRFGLDVLLPTDRRVATIAALAAAGYADRMVVAHDASCRIDWFAPETLAALAPNWHFTFIHDEVLPALRAAGVTAEQVTTMLVDVPRRHLAGGL